MKLKLIVLASMLLSLAMVSCGPADPDDVPVVKKEDTSIISVSTEMPPIVEHADNPLSRAGVELGRFLFYDKLLSENNSISCGSCHNQAMAFTDNNKVFSEGTVKQLGTRNSMPTFNLMWFDSLFWDSRAQRLKQLVLMPIENPLEMNTTPEQVVEKLKKLQDYKDKFRNAFGTEEITVEKMAMALEQFLKTIVSDNSRFDKAKRGELALTDLEKRGFELAGQKGCFNCHSTSLFTDNLSHNTGLDFVSNQGGQFKDNGLGGFTKIKNHEGKFKTPSLRNVALSSPYMHDGRFKTLEEVLEFYDEGVKSNLNSRNISFEFMQQGTLNKLTPQDTKALLAFLNSLTDYDLISNPKFSDPFQ
ncbi:MAG: c-type cytochrome [Flavobacteriales bacterium]|nr:c-type cytochrome [Flavobacteriales bacterium]